jgi:hypothetical protein
VVRELWSAGGRLVPRANPVDRDVLPSWVDGHVRYQIPVCSLSNLRTEGSRSLLQEQRLGGEVMSSLRSRGGIFISYRREETAAYAGRLYDRLSDHFGEARVFMDIDSIAIGVDFTKALIEAVSGCNVLLALIGRDWSAITDGRGRRRIDDPADWMRVEIETALQRDIRIVPVLVDGAVLPLPDDLPPSLRPLIRRQALELSHISFRSEVARLISAVDEVLENRSGKSVEASGTSSRTPVAQQGRWRLDLISNERYKKTYDLRLGREVHVLTVRIGFPGDMIDLDGIPMARGHINSKEYPLAATSPSLGLDSTIKVIYRESSLLRVMKFMSITLQIGGQILIAPLQP